MRQVDASSSECSRWRWHRGLVLLSDTLIAALRRVDRPYFCLDARGEQLHQTSNPDVVARMLQLLDVERGSRVFEIGTGSGYRTALLAELVGPEGTVVSVDVDPELTRRATVLLDQKGYS